MSENDSRNPGSAPRPLLGVSACLLGEQVRFDGGHKRNPFITEQLCQHLGYLSTCPEAAIGLGIPRPPLQLVATTGEPRLLRVDDHTFDITDQMVDYAHRRLAQLSGIDGYIFKKGSPSCGVERVKIYNETGGAPRRKGRGLFANALMEHYPLLPIEDEERLEDALLRENFVNRIYVHHRWRLASEQGWSAARLLEFHTRHKYLLMAHSQAAYRRMGKVLANLSGVGLNEQAQRYFTELMTALKRRVTPKRHINVLQHIMGYLKKSIDQGDRQELQRAIESYRRGEVPLLVPITLLGHYLRNHPDPYITRQVYLQPHPQGLGLRNLL